MKTTLQKVFSFIKRVFLFLKLHVRIEAGIRGSNENDNTQSKGNSDDPEVK